VVVGIQIQVMDFDSNEQQFAFGLSGEDWTLKTNVGRFASFLFEITVGHSMNDDPAIPWDTAAFISEIIKAGWSWDSPPKRLFRDIFETLKRNDLQMMEGVNSTEVPSFVIRVESSEQMRINANTWFLLQADVLDILWDCLLIVSAVMTRNFDIGELLTRIDDPWKHFPSPLLKIISLQSAIEPWSNLMCIGDSNWWYDAFPVTSTPIWEDEKWWEQTDSDPSGKWSPLIHGYNFSMKNDVK
jgi:hypothetical protein